MYTDNSSYVLFIPFSLNPRPNFVKDPSLYNANFELSEEMRKKKEMSATRHLKFRSPFYVLCTGIGFQAKMEDVYYFFGGPKNVEDVHIYMNPPRRNQPGRFSGDAMLELKSLDALVEVLKMDGEKLFSRLINVYHVIPGSRKCKRYSALHLKNVLASARQQENRDHYKLDYRKNLKVPNSDQTVIASAAMEVKEKVGLFQRQISADSFGIKHMGMGKKMMAIKKELLDREQESSVHYQPSLHVDGRSGYDRISSILPFMQSVSQQQQFQSVRILKSLSGNNYLAISLNADLQYKRRKQSVEFGNYNMPMNKSHQNVKGFTQNSENALPHPKREMKYTSRGVGKYTDSESDSDENTNNVNPGVAIPSTKLAKPSKDAIFNNSDELNKFPESSDCQGQVPEKSAHAFALIDDDGLFDAPKSKSSTTKTDKKGKFEYDDSTSRTIPTFSKSKPTHSTESTEQTRQLSTADTGSKRTKMKVTNDNANSSADEVSTADYRTRTPSNATSLAGRMRKLRAQDLTPDDLAKLGNVIQTMVKYRFPRTILFGDIMEIMEEMEPRFSSMEHSLGITHKVFLKRYCPTVQTFGSSNNPNLILKEDTD
ncbi:hypothetical protein DdX_06184 [Ditylenchus destructor]|uniref:Uncharacterized protein n=1 Tax=Ditylenchus destructor TaxID=166010 RepID=A0AAD4N8G4_9BILA|nr:hypothetical protein DdX_06184 [Ditylenchus destructor]